MGKHRDLGCRSPSNICWMGDGGTLIRGRGGYVTREEYGLVSVAEFRNGESWSKKDD